MADGIERLMKVGSAHLHPGGLFQPWWFVESIDVLAFLLAVAAATGWACLWSCRRCCCASGDAPRPVGRFNKGRGGQKAD